MCGGTAARSSHTLPTIPPVAGLVVDGHGPRSMPNRLDRAPLRDAILRITARARIHCGLLNTSGLYTRVDGGIGFSVEDPLWEIEVGYGTGLGKSKIPSEFVS